MENTKYELVGYKPVDRGRLRGFVAVRIPDVGITLQGIRHIKKAYVEYLEQPSKFGKDSSPMKVFEFDTSAGFDHFQESVIPQIHEYLNGTPQGEDNSDNQQHTGQAE